MCKLNIVVVCILYCLSSSLCDFQQIGPDPWNLQDNNLNEKNRDDKDIPPDLKIYPKRKQSSSNLGTGEWFFRRMLMIVLKGGEVKNNEDGSVDVLLQMKLDQNRWDTLEQYSKSDTALTEEMYRRSVGYIEQSIYQPSIPEKIVMMWSDYVQIYLIEYKFYITWGAALLAVSFTMFWLWRRMSHKHLVIVILILLYLYEVFVSYKEAEQKELDTFLDAVNSCKWKFWSSSCELPKPDPLIFLKHMNPLKIGVRMFIVIISEPMITISEVLKTMVQGITDGLWYPLDKIVYGFLIIFFNITLLLVLIMVIFNFIFNIPFNLSLWFINLGVSQRRRSLFSNSNNNVNNQASVETRGDTISGETLNRVFDVCLQALSTAQSSRTNVQSTSNQITLTSNTAIKRSSSTGRLSELARLPIEISRPGFQNLRKRTRVDGSGDA